MARVQEIRNRAIVLFWFLLALLMPVLSPAFAADPIRVGFSLALTGGVAANGKMIMAALELWRDDVNEKGGLLGRPIELVYYDDQSSPANVPGIYTKLLTVDKVDLLLGPYATNMVAPAMPVIIQNNKVTISFTAIGINRHFNYPKYFSMVPVGPDGVNSFSRGFFELAAVQTPRPQTVAILAADAEFARSASDGARTRRRSRASASSTTRAIHPRPPISRRWCVRCRPPMPTSSTSRPIRPTPSASCAAATEANLTPKMFGGAMIGLLVTPIKVQLGALANGLVIGESFVPPPTFNFPGLADLLKRYQAKAPSLGIDPLGYAFVPFGYAAGQMLAQAVTGNKKSRP